MSEIQAESMVRSNAAGFVSKSPLAISDRKRASFFANAGGLTGQKRKRVLLDGESASPGECVLPANSTLQDARQAAGNLISNAYLSSSEFEHERAIQAQQRDHERALRDFETQITAGAAMRSISNAEEAITLTSGSGAHTRSIRQLRSLRPTYGMLLNLEPQSQELPESMTEDVDRLSIPSRSTTLEVFDSMFSTGCYLHSPDRTVGDFLRLAGGPTRGGDNGSVFMICAHGPAISSLQAGSWFSRGNQIAGQPAEPVATVCVPEEMNKTNWMQDAKDWTQIFYQFGIGLAGIKNALQ